MNFPKCYFSLHPKSNHYADLNILHIGFLLFKSCTVKSHSTHRLVSAFFHFTWCMWVFHVVNSNSEFIFISSYSFVLCTYPVHSAFDGTTIPVLMIMNNNVMNINMHIFVTYTHISVGKIYRMKLLDFWICMCWTFIGNFLKWLFELAPLTIIYSCQTFKSFFFCYSSFSFF